MPLSQNIAVVIGTVLASLLVMAGLNRVWPKEKRRAYNDLIGWELTVLGTTYGVILGFMLYAVWTSLGQAELNVDIEANAVVDLYRLADGLPQPARTDLQRLARDYVDTVIAQDWPQMARGEVPEQSTAIDQQMWKVVTSVKASSPTEINAQEHVMSELSSLGQRRFTRIRQGKTRLPNVLWWLLLVGGGLTIISSCALGSDSVKVQGLEVFSFALLIALSLVAIANIHHPFRGPVRISDYDFQRARQSIQAHSTAGSARNNFNILEQESGFQLCGRLIFGRTICGRTICGRLICGKATYEKRSAHD